MLIINIIYYFVLTQTGIDELTKHVWEITPANASAYGALVLLLLSGCVFFLKMWIKSEKEKGEKILSLSAEVINVAKDMKTLIEHINTDRELTKTKIFGLLESNNQMLNSMIQSKLNGK